MNSALPKVLHDLAGWPLLAYPLAAVGASERVARTIVVIGTGADEVRARMGERDRAAGPVEWVVQDPPRGTGDAVATAGRLLEGFDGVVLIVNGDGPLIDADAHRAVLEAIDAGADGAFLTAELDDPGAYGRVVRSPEGVRIVEAADADDRTRAIREINVGAYAFRWDLLSSALERLGPDNARGEVYLTDVVATLVADGRSIEPVLAADPDVARGVNTQAELAAVNSIWQRRLRGRLMEAGVAMPAPETVFLEQEVEVGSDTIIHPYCVLRRGTRIGRGCAIGPFAHLRGGVDLADGAEIGNFVEVKKSTFGPGAKAKHLAYIGDAEVGERANVGAGTIVANYDGRNKHRTRIGDRAFVGSGTVLVAPVEVGDEARTGAGAVVLAGRNVPPGETAVGVPARLLGAREGQG